VPIQSRYSKGPLVDSLLDFAGKAFYISLVLTIALYGYLFWGLFSGELADVTHMSKADQLHALSSIQTLSNWLNFSLAVTLISSIVLFWEADALSVILLIVAAFLAYGLQFGIDTLFAADAARFKSGAASEALLKELHLTAIMIGIPGILLAVRNIILRLFDSQRGDYATMTYGKNAVKEEVKRPLIGAFAKCWQLPFCREGVRVRCPIYHARTKCWKERVGCMCEENIILLAMGGEERETNTSPLTKESGFVPIGDLLAKNTEKTRASIPTRVGPRGVRIPTNPHLTDSQKRERCRNCVIYNEHQRQKYQLLSAPVTMAVPILVFLEFDNLRGLMTSALSGLDQLIAHITFTTTNQSAIDLTHQVSGSLPVETILIVTITLVIMTWAQRLLEFCTFKIKI
jgi:hypothetical protein